MTNIVLTMDVELWNWRGNFAEDIEKPVLKTIELLQKETVPITLFISLSDKGFKCENYFYRITDFVSSLPKTDLIEIGIHTHCRNLSVPFPTKSDNLRDYNQKQIEEIVTMYKEALENSSKRRIYAHRAGSYAIPPLKVLDEIFERLKITVDSSDIFIYHSEIRKYESFYEIPPATNEQLSKNLRVFSPDQMSFNEMIKFYNKSKSYSQNLVINSHSFSMYGESIIRPSSLSVRFWYGIPSFLQKMLRPEMKIYQKIYRKFRGHEPNENTEAFETLRKIIAFLKQDGCKFVTFDDLAK